MVNRSKPTIPDTGSMSIIRGHSDVVRKSCHRVFGNPSIENENTLGGLNGGVFVDFLEGFGKSIKDMKIEPPHEMIHIEDPGGSEEVKLIVQEVLNNRKESKQISRLAHEIYKKFLEVYIEEITYSNDEERIKKEYHIICFTMTFIQAFDAVLLTGAQTVTNSDEWNGLKEDMYLLALNLSLIPSDIQQGLTSSSREIMGYECEGDQRYMLDHIQEIFNKLLRSRDIYPQIKERIEEKGGYGVCPALKDGTLKEAFDILFDIYGEILVGK